MCFVLQVEQSHLFEECDWLCLNPLFVLGLCGLPQGDRTLAANPQTHVLHIPSAPGKIEMSSFIFLLSQINHNTFAL